ncbi:DNA circularization N-terminal domain-containing protein [Luteibacter yeojuensis]|uniref:DNA circulation N-terminal domain-containing protein n=1 Tax=Luteibacter yeojuensis TaxID=345309 RepID=A0A0F3KIT0_9GAMM|nr:DNA circularization N-terminal domain-containing protein [Luteibacter yeojuensis]KJV30029.1 hypothetical protein VI08_15310 [Luteibacter yeojuensis]
MSWSETLLDASFRGVPIDIAADQMNAARMVTNNAIPYRDGEEGEDMGREARVVSLRIAVLGDDYEQRLQALIAALDQGGPGELIHPVYGPLRVLVSRYTVEHAAETPDYAEVSAVFVEHALDQPFFIRSFEGIDSAAATLGRPDGDWRRHVRDLLGRSHSLIGESRGRLMGGWEGLVHELLGRPGIGLRLAQMRAQSRAVLADLESIAGAPMPAFDVMALPNRVAAEVVDLHKRMALTLPPTRGPMTSRGAVDTIMPGVPGRDTLPGPVVRVWSELLTAARDGQVPEASRLVMPGLHSDAAALHAAGLLMVVHTSQALAIAAATAMALDQQRAEPTLLPSDIDRLVMHARAMLQGGIALRRLVRPDHELARAVDPMKNTAALILEAGRQIVLTRPPLTRRTVGATTCLRALAHLWYGEHERAVELQRLNPTLRRPYAIPAGTVLHAYAR